MIITRRLQTLTLCLLLTPAFAAPPIAAADKAAIAKCMGAADEKSGYGEKCVGIIADPCIAAARSRDSFDADAKACATRELAVWTERLQAALKQASAGGPPGAAAALTETQASWAKSRESLCPVFNKIDQGMYLGGADYCRLQETARRDLILERLVAAVSEH